MKTAKSVIVATFGALALAGVLVLTNGVAAHCQIPCGIYNDAARFTLLAEHIMTMEKSVSQILDLSKDPSKNAGQLVRWTLNKENHADAFAEVVTRYFLQQRIKPVASRSGPEWEAYMEQLTVCHEMLVGSMKVKQTTDPEVVAKLERGLSALQKAYFGARSQKNQPAGSQSK